MKLGNKKSYSIKDYAKREVNLLPDSHRRVGKFKFAKFMAFIVAILLVFSFAFYEYSLIKKTDEFKESTTKMQIQIQSNQETMDNQAIIMSLGNRIALKEVLLNFIFSSNRSIVDILDVFESNTNSEVYLTNLSANSTESFVINASATSHEAISHLINQLKLLKKPNGDKYFESVFTSGITRNEDEDGLVSYLFQLNCNFEGGTDYEVE